MHKQAEEEERLKKEFYEKYPNVIRNLLAENVNQLVNQGHVVKKNEDEFEADEDDEVVVLEKPVVGGVAQPFEPVQSPTIKVEPTKDQPKHGETKSGFINTSEMTPGAVNIFVPGPWADFWCQDCGRKLAP